MTTEGFRYKLLKELNKIEKDENLNRYTLSYWAENQEDLTGKPYERKKAARLIIKLFEKNTGQPFNIEDLTAHIKQNNGDLSIFPIKLLWLENERMKNTPNQENVIKSK